MLFKRRGTHSGTAMPAALFLALWVRLWAQPTPLQGVAPDRPDVHTIIRRSVEANQRDWDAAPEYDYTDRSWEKSGGTRAYAVTMLEGSPYSRLVAVNGRQLSPDEQKTEEEKFEQATAGRRSESPDARAARVGKYERGRARDHLLMEQLSVAMDFNLLGEESVGGYQCYVLGANPRAGYRPPNSESEVLTGMRGKLWIDEVTYQWAKVQAIVVHPVSIGGILARVERGTRFELEKKPAGGGVWFKSHFSMSARARIVYLFGYRNREEDWYANYRIHQTMGSHK